MEGDQCFDLRNRRAGDAIRAATNVTDATRAGMAYERPQGWTPGNPEAGSGWANRLGEAQRLAGGAAGAPASPAAMLQPSVLPDAPSPLAAAFVAPPDDEAIRQRAVAAAQEQQKRAALLGGGGIGQMFA